MNRRAIGALTLSLLAGTTLTHAAGTTTPPATHTIDPASGLAVTTTTGERGTTSFEITTGRLTVRKDVLLGRSVTTITSGSDRVSFTIDHEGIVVSTRAGVTTAALRHPETMLQVVEALAEAPAVSDAAALLSRLRLDPATTTGQALALTKALLQSVAGDGRGTLEVVNRVREATRRPHIVAVGLGLTSGDCWGAYTAEANRTANEYADCYNNTSWYDVIDRLACSTVYDVEAEGDWLDYLNCVGSATTLITRRPSGLVTGRARRATRRRDTPTPP